MYICNKCFIVFTRKDKYIQHIQNMHSNDTGILLGRDYKCKYCGQQYKTKSYYDKHMNETCVKHKDFEQNIINVDDNKIVNQEDSVEKNNDECDKKTQYDFID